MGRKRRRAGAEIILERIKQEDPEKYKLIKKIWKLEPEIKAVGMDLTKYGIEELKHHIKNVKARGKR